SHGASNAKVVASILSGRDEELPYILLDGDATGKRMANDLKSGIYQVSKEKVVCTDEAAGFPDSEIEDLFPADFLADVVDRWERRPDKSFGDTFVIGRPIVPQIKAWAASHDIALEEGWKVELARAVKKRALDRSSSFNDENLDRWAALFTSLGVG
ncbi:MAG: OLD family endonuclease, partial [Proteobacteria bacterium]|nr:OLD family endonuclease [Pseudomonadota bacterium]